MALSPLASAGYLLWVARLISYSRKSGASATVLASQYSRWMQHQLGTRRDEPCEQLMRVLPNAPALALALVTAPTRLGHRLTGIVPRMYRYPYTGEPILAHHATARTTYFDEALQEHAKDVEQFVVLGAGLDTRNARLPSGSAVRCFEVDAPKTQAFKLALLRQAGVHTPNVTYVAADFARESWLDRLMGAGFDPKKPTFFLWESVCMYLERGAVVKTLREVASTAGGNVIAFDYLAKELIEDRSRPMRILHAFLKAVGEPWRFGIEVASPEAVAPGGATAGLGALLDACGLAFAGQQLVWQDQHHRRYAAGFVTARVPRTSP